MEVRRRRIARNKRKLVFRLLLVFFVLLLISAGIVGSIVLLRQNSNKAAELVEQPFTVTDQCVFTGNGFFYISNNTLYYDDLTNSKNGYSASFPDTNVQLAGSANIQLMYNSMALQLVGHPYPVDLSGELLSVKCGSAHFAVLRKDANGTESIQIFDSKGEQQDHLEYNAQYIMNYGFYTAPNEYLYVITLALSSGTPQTTITVYDLTSKYVSGVMNVQNQLLEQMHFTSTGIYAVGTNHIIRYALSTNKEAYRTTIYGWNVLDYDNGSQPSFLLTPRSAESLRVVKLLTLNDADLAKTGQQLVQLPHGSIAAFIMGNRLVAVSPSGYTVYDMGGKPIGEKRFDVSINDAKKLDSATLLLSAGSKQYTVKITS